VFARSRRGHAGPIPALVARRLIARVTGWRLWFAA
jgi:hypothetical protein